MVRREEEKEENRKKKEEREEEGKERGKGWGGREESRGGAGRREDKESLQKVRPRLMDLPTRTDTDGYAEPASALGS